MFGRQWFSSSSQQGMHTTALEYEELLQDHKLNEAESFLRSVSSQNLYYWKRQYMRLLKLQYRRNKEYACGPQPIKYAVRGFWPGLDPLSNQILDIFRVVSPERSFEYVEDTNQSDLSFHSCYSDLNYLSNSCASCRVLFLGENVRPSYTEYDFSLTSDMHAYCNRNCYLPLWLLEIDWFSKVYPDRKPFSIDSICADREIDYSTRYPAAVYVGNNHEPFRLEILNSLQRDGIDVEIYGSQSRPIENKVELYSQYMFAICPENSYYPGYVTEKLIHAFMGGCIPIYWGCLSGQSFNNHPMIIDLSKSSVLHLGTQIKDLLNRRAKIGRYPKLTSSDFPRQIFNTTLAFASKILSQYSFL